MNGTTNTEQTRKTAADHALDAISKMVGAPALTPTKGQHPADGSPRFTVTGEHGQVVYDVLGNHAAVITPAGEVLEAMGKAFAARMREYVDLGDDDALFAALTDVYRTDLVCRNCGGTGMDSTRHLDVLEDHPCGYCGGAGGAR